MVGEEESQRVQSGVGWPEGRNCQLLLLLPLPVRQPQNCTSSDPTSSSQCPPPHLVMLGPAGTLAPTTTLRSAACSLELIETPHWLLFSIDPEVWRRPCLFQLVFPWLQVEKLVPFFSRSLSLRSPMVMSVSHISGRKGTGREGEAEVTPTDRPLVAVRSISPGRPHRTNESITDGEPGDPHTTQMGVVGDLDLDVRGPPRRPSSWHRMKPLSLLRHGHGDGRPPDWASRENFLSRLSSHVSRLLRIPHDPHPPSPTLDQTGLFTEAHHPPTSTEPPPSWWKWKWEWKKPGPLSCPTLLWLTEVQPPSSWGACSPRPWPRHITSRPPHT